MSTPLRHDQSDFNVIFVHSALDDAGLSVRAFRLYCHFARRAGKDGFINSGADDMAAVCRMKRDTVFRAMNELEQRAMMVRQERPGATNLYTLTRPSEWRTKLPIPNEGMSPETGLQPSPETGLQPSPETGHKGNPLKVIQKGNPLATATPSRGRPLDFAFEMMVKIQGSCLNELTKSERGKINASLKSIREAMPELSSEDLAHEIERRARKYNELMPAAMLTANALANHWSKCASEKPMADTIPRLSAPPLTVEMPPDGFEDAMEALFGGEWQEQCPAWPQMTGSDKSQVRAWIRANGKDAA